MIFAKSDKKGGLVVVPLNRYIQNSLVHLKDQSTYEFISEEEILKRYEVLCSEIFKWTVKIRKEVEDYTVAFLKAKLKEPKKSLSVSYTSSINFTKIQLKQDQST